LLDNFRTLRAGFFSAWLPEEEEEAGVAAAELY